MNSFSYPQALITPQKENHCTEREEKIKIKQKKSLLLQKNNLSFHPKIIIIILLKPQFSFKLTWLYQIVVKERKFTQPMPKEKQLLTNIYTYSYIPKKHNEQQPQRKCIFPFTFLHFRSLSHQPNRQKRMKRWRLLERESKIKNIGCTWRGKKIKPWCF